jgi:hypothetical protein
MFTLTDIQQVKLKLSGKSAAGNPAMLEDATVTSSDESVVTVAANADGSFTLASTGKLGTSQIVAKADAQIGDGVAEISGIETIEVVSSQAVVLDLNFEAPSPK